jgi:asparagine synthase (glutamine-hydrolysing)
MCGLCGWVGRVPNPERLRAACGAMEHRGPDGEGVWLGPRVMLGHRRLAIIDLSAAADQPATNETGSVRLVFNGEVYNFAELRRELEPNHHFRSHGDTEVLAHGYEQWGMAGLLKRVRGMFALALWDGDREELHLARDPLGKKPLYYAEEGGALHFASTLPALLELLGRVPEVRPEAVQDYLLQLCVPGDECWVEGVQKLLPAEHLVFRAGTTTRSRYWSATFAAQEDASEGAWLERMDAELRRAVRDRLVSDVPLGVFLSGGVDSSLVAALAAELSSGPVTTVSAGFVEEGFSELPYARTVADHLGTRHHEHMIRADAAAILPWLVYTAGEPFGDHAVLPAMLLAQAARQHMTVVLSGDGGDEVFAGYPGPLLARLSGPYRTMVPGPLRRQGIPAMLRWLETHGASGPARRLRRLAEPSRERLDWVFDALGERGYRGRLDLVLAPELRARLGSRDPDLRWRRAFQSADGPTDADRVLFTELTTLLPDQFLVKADVATMAYGLEGRSPLLDVGVVELAGRIPAAVKTAGLQPKRLLKRLAERYVPREVLYRKKHGFSVPTGRWIRGPLRAATREILTSEAAMRRGLFDPRGVERLLDEHFSGRADHGQRLWLLLQAELWMCMFVDGTVAPSDRMEVASQAAA